MEFSWIFFEIFSRLSVNLRRAGSSGSSLTAADLCACVRWSPLTVGFVVMVLIRDWPVQGANHQGSDIMRGITSYWAKLHPPRPLALSIHLFHPRILWERLTKAAVWTELDRLTTSYAQIVSREENSAWKAQIVAGSGQRWVPVVLLIGHRFVDIRPYCSCMESDPGFIDSHASDGLCKFDSKFLKAFLS